VNQWNLPSGDTTNVALYAHDSQYTSYPDIVATGTLLRDLHDVAGGAIVHTPGVIYDSLSLVATGPGTEHGAVRIGCEAVQPELYARANELAELIAPAAQYSSIELNTGCNYFIGNVDPSSDPNVEVIATDGVSNWLYCNDTEDVAFDILDTPLTGAEAAVTRSSRVFQNTAGMSFETIAELMRPIMGIDRLKLLELRNVTSGYFHSLDLTLLEIQAEMTAFQDALNGALAGSIEVALASLQGMQVGGTTYTEDIISTGFYGMINSTATTTQKIMFNWYGSSYQSAALDIKGGVVTLNDGNVGAGEPFDIRIPTGTAGGAVTLGHFNDPAMRMVISHPDYPDFVLATQGTFVAGPSGNYIQYTGPAGSAPAGLDALTDNMYVQGSDGLWTISFTNQANTEKDQMIQWLIHSLETHLVKFPR
jgi:hypothetical protein